MRPSPLSLRCLITAISSLACLTTLPLLADYTYVWTGEDPRFSGTFSISNSDYTNRQFSSLSGINFQFHDGQNPSLSIILNSLNSVHGGGNDSGWLTADGRHLDHSKNELGGNVSFWIAAWQYPGIDVGLYSWNPLGDASEYFQYYANSSIIAETRGSWSLQPIPEPGAACLMSLWFCCWVIRKLRFGNL
jgi:hypothetical protein